jgi:hypothetical protein
VRWRFIVTMCVHKSADPMDLLYSWTCHAWCMESIARTWHARSSPRNPKAKRPQPQLPAIDHLSTKRAQIDRCDQQNRSSTKQKSIPLCAKTQRRTEHMRISGHLGPVRWSSHPVPFL